MKVWSRPAAAEDLESLLPLYQGLEEEQTALRSMWRLADGLPEPMEAAFKEILDDDDSLLVIGFLDEVPLGFAWARSEELLPQANGARVAVIRLIHTESDARGIGIGEMMMDQIFGHFRARGVGRFDARVSPGHRNAKNFFEANGFKARLIVMSRDDDA